MYVGNNLNTHSFRVGRVAGCEIRKIENNLEELHTTKNSHERS